MSGPKGGSYDVETAAQREARMLRDAKANYAGACSAWESASVVLAAVGAVTVEHVRVARPPAPSVRADSSAYARAAAELHEAALRLTASATAARERAAARRHAASIARIVDSLPASPQMTPTTTRQHRRPDAAVSRPMPSVASIDPARTEQRVRRRLAELAAFDHDTERVQVLVGDIAAAGSPARVDLIMRELDLMIEDARAAAAREESIRRARADLAALQARIADVSGPTAERLRGRIAQVIRQDPPSVPPELPGLVEQAIQHADAEADRLHVVEVVNAALERLGYNIGPQFSTDLTGARGTAYARNGSSRYGIKVRLEPESTRFSAQAVKSDGVLTSAQEDAAAEREFCAAFDSLVALAARDGVALDVDVRAEAGAYGVQQVTDAQLGSPRAASAEVSEDRADEMTQGR